MNNNELFEYMNRVRNYYVDGPSKMSITEYMKTILVRDEDNIISVPVAQSENVLSEKAIVLSDVLAEETNYWNASIWGPIQSPSRIKKFIKRVIRKTIYWLIEPVFARQSEFNRAAAQALRDISDLSNSTLQDKKAISDRMKLLQDNMNMTESKLATMMHEIKGMTEKDQELLSELHLLHDAIVKNAAETARNAAEMARNKAEADEGAAILCVLHDEVAKHNAQAEKSALSLQDQMEKYKAETDQKLGRTQIDMNYMNFKMRQLTKNISMRTDLSGKEFVPFLQEELPVPLKKYEVDYFAFENRFRGNEKSIKDSQKMYLPYFANKNNIIDIGCGRGEFLELLAENNIPATGVDMYPDFVEYCGEKGLHVELNDALSYLKTCEDNSIGGIFAGQVIEHLSQEYLLELIDVAYSKLSRGAFFIAETPNPQLLLTFTNAFYLDMSHTKPVHPETMRFLLESAGYLDIAVIYNEKSKIDYKLPLLNAENVKDLEGFNNGINQLNDLLFGYQDYTIVGRR